MAVGCRLVCRPRRPRSSVGRVAIARPLVGYLEAATSRRSGTDPRQSCAPPVTGKSHGPRARSHLDHRYRPDRRVRRRPHRAPAAACPRSSATSWPASRSGRSRPASSPITAIAPELAELGVILLMFGVGIHFSIRDLLAVRSHRHPGRHRPDDHRGAARHRGSGTALGWGVGGGLVLGLALSVASTVVLLRALRTATSSTRRRAASRSAG